MPENVQMQLTAKKQIRNAILVEKLGMLLVTAALVEMLATSILEHATLVAGVDIYHVIVEKVAVVLVVATEPNVFAVE